MDETQRVAVKKPTYVKGDIQTGIVHIGPSAFFRGHLALIVDDLLEKGEKSLGICAVSLKTQHVRDALKPQQFSYTVVEQSAEGNNARIINSIKEILVAPENPQAVIDKLASPEVKLVTLTVTQAGYYYRNGNLDVNHPDICTDLGKIDEPASTVGFLVSALDRRRKAGLEPFTVLSCDNLPGNGTILRNVVLAYAAQVSPELRDWIAEKAAFPCTMVDRIVPKTTDDHITAHKETYGYHDNWPVYTEKFIHFVIEKPKNGASLGGLEKSEHVQLVDDVTPYELMKIRLLNGTHMALGMIGRMAGYTHTHEAIRDPAIREYIGDLMSEMESTLPPTPGTHMPSYKESIFSRLENTSMKDELARLARNGVDKLESRFLSPLRDAMARGTKTDNLVFAVASWIKYLKRSGADFDILDQKAIEMKLPEKAVRDGNSASSLLAHSDIFDRQLSSSAPFTAALDKMVAIPDGQFPARSDATQLAPAALVAAPKRVA